MDISQAEQILGVRHGASETSLKAAYKERAQACHPDHPAGSAEAFQLVGAAFEALQQHRINEQWGTSSAAIGAHITAKPKLIEHRR
jgi:DnaJ-class molecular chaperone